jgi:hypothetical protein
MINDQKYWPNRVVNVIKSECRCGDQKNKLKLASTPPPLLSPSFQRDNECEEIFLRARREFQNLLSCTNFRASLKWSFNGIQQWCVCVCMFNESAVLQKKFVNEHIFSSAYVL